MKYRTFARSDEQISLLGYGAWGIGKALWVGADDKESKESLHLAVRNGVNFFDTALVYGNGHSEKLVGEVEKECGKNLFVASKIPSKRFEWPASNNSTLTDSFPKDHIIQMTEKSLKNLGREYLDLQQFHVWNDKWAAEDEWKEAIEHLKRQGKVRYFGISINDHQPENGIEAGKTGLIDSYQVIFNLFDQSPKEKLFPFCLKNNISIIARVPLDEGGLTGTITPETAFPAGDFRQRYFRGERKQEILDRVQKIQEISKNETETLPETALRFIISFSAVTTVIPGMRKKKHLQANADFVEKGCLSPALVDTLEEHQWIRNFYL
jgi:aryl-alcohol dehydrogenase-like predicted oxidoreductase